MVREGIVLGHSVSERGIEVDKVKIEVIETTTASHQCERSLKLLQPRRILLALQW
jgi:hypothetical protein